MEPGLTQERGIPRLLGVTTSVNGATEGVPAYELGRPPTLLFLYHPRDHFNTVSYFLGETRQNWKRARYYDQGPPEL